MANILHIWDQAGVACILAKYQKQTQGHNSKVLISNNIDRFGIYDFYKEYIINVKPDELFDSCIRETEKADIIHIHSRVDFLFDLRNVIGNQKKIIFHYHGTDLRGIKKFQLPHRSLVSDLVIMTKMLARNTKSKLVGKRIRKKTQALADVILVATPDLQSLISDAVYLPNPVDTEHFKPEISLNHEKDRRPSYLTINTETTDLKLVIEHCKRKNINLDNLEIYDRTKRPIMYKDMPKFLKGYQLYVDVRYVNGRILRSLSKTALEAMSCCISVVDYQSNFHKALPAKHDPHNVVEMLSRLYDDEVRS